MSRLTGQFILSLEASQAVADMYVEDILLERKARRPKDVLKAINAVSKEAVCKAGQTIFVDKGLNLAVITPKADKPKLESQLRFDI